MISLLNIVAALVSLLLAIPNTSIGTTSGITLTELNQVITDLNTGTITFEYQTREGIRGNGQGLEISLGHSTHRSYFNGVIGEDYDMVEGPAQVFIKIREGRIHALDISVGKPRKAMSVDRDLGSISPCTAAAFFLEQAPQLDEDIADEVLLGAVIARDAEVATYLLAMVSDRSNQDELRQAALFWTAVLASEKALEPIRHLINENNEEMELREHAIFALSQLDHTDTLPLLMEIARNDREPQLQRAAFFALAEHDTPEVHQLFEEILLGN